MQHTHVCEILSDNSHQASARAVCVVRLISMADRGTERLHVLLTASNSRHCITCTYIIKPLLMSAEEITAALE